MKALTKLTKSVRPQDVEKKWILIDAEDLVVGRLASTVANILRGKHKPSYTPHVDCGDHVVIINTDKAVLTGNKMEKKIAYHHSGWIGGMKSVQYRTLMAEHSDDAMMMAVKGMLPGNTLGANALKRLRVYKGAQHVNEAQKPEAYTL